MTAGISEQDIAAIRESDLFDAEWYLAQYPDVGTLGIDPAAHYLWLGARLGRNPSPEFDTIAYLDANFDVAATGANPLLHYVKFGMREGRGGTVQPCMPAGAGIEAGPAAPASGQPDSLGAPRRQRMDGARLLTQSRDREHFWYRNHATEAFLSGLHRVTPLPAQIRRLLVIAHDFRLQTGCTRSISHYLNAVTPLGGQEFTSIELAPAALASVALNHVDAHDFVIVNSLAPFVAHEGMVELVRHAGPKKAAIYLHETEWVFEKFKAEHPARFETFAKALKDFNVLCVSQMQHDWLRAEYGVENSIVVHEATTLSKPAGPGAFRERLDPSGPLRIVMAGTVQPRKGPALFSKVADLAAEAGLPWTFHWAGKPVGNEPVYQSDRVEWLGNLDGDTMSDFVAGADIFFLSSEDDPFPLCVLEALQARKRAVVYARTGVSELFDGGGETPGFVFRDFTPEAAFAALREAAGAVCDAAIFERIDGKLSLGAFVSRLNEALAVFAGAERQAEPAGPEEIAVLAQVNDAAAWPEIRTGLAALRDRRHRVNILLGPAAETDDGALRDAIRRDCPDVHFCPIGIAFAEALAQVAPRGDLVVGLAAAPEGANPCDGLLTSMTDVARIVETFRQYPDVELLVSKNRAPESRPLEGAFWARAGAAQTMAGTPDKLPTPVVHDGDVPLSVRLLKDRHKGEDIYVVAAGASGNFLDPAFFEGKTVIGINRVFMHFPCTYAVFKEYCPRAHAALRAGSCIPVVARGDSGNLTMGRRQKNTLFFRDAGTCFFDHLENMHDRVDLSPIGADDGKLVVSWSSITSAMHLAALMGARNIILVGHDCGLLDGKATVDGYYESLKESPWEDAAQYNQWLGRIESQTLEVKRALKSAYGCNTVSLNPFVNFGLERHRYSRGEAGAGAVGTEDVPPQKPVLLLCNGPSAKNMRVPADLDDYAIARLNLFFLEDEPFAGGRVDHLFWALNESTFYEHLGDMLKSGRYRVRHFNTPVPLEKMTYPDGQPVARRPFCAPEALVDHWALIAKSPRLGRFMMSRPFPTSGMQALAALACAGHRKFAIAGMDLYSKNAEKRHAFAVPDIIAQKLDPKHFKPGYEAGAHALYIDLSFLGAILDEFPTIEIELLSEMKILEEFLAGR